MLHVISTSCIPATFAQVCKRDCVLRASVKDACKKGVSTKQHHIRLEVEKLPVIKVEKLK